jgi:hypothetical protein
LADSESRWFLREINKCEDGNCGKRKKQGIKEADQRKKLKGIV